MRTFAIADAEPTTGEYVAALGTFDGVHQGQKSMLREIRSLAERHDARVGVMVVEGGAHHRARMLTSLEHRLELIEETGAVDTVWIIPSSIHDHASEGLGAALDVVRPLSLVISRFLQLGWPDRLTANDFESLCKTRSIELVPMGKGTAEEDLAAGALFTAMNLGGLLAEGHVAEAGWLLGRMFEMRGTVETGDQRGRTLGVPTANLGIESTYLIPKEGVYAGVTILGDGSAHATAISLGRRPTFYDDGWELLEAHLLDFDGDLYGSKVRVLFSELLRNQRKFASMHELKAQLHLDIACTRSLDPVNRYHASLEWRNQSAPF